MWLQLTSTDDSRSSAESLRALPEIEIQPATTSSRELHSLRRPVLRLRIEEGLLHYFDSSNPQSGGASYAPLPRGVSTTLDQLSKVLRTAGIDVQKLDRSAENAMRLAVVASVVETLEPSHPKTDRQRPVAGLPKWRLSRVLTYIDTNIGDSITLASLSAAAGLSRMHFARQFRSATGMRPHDYVLRRRIARAQQMLAVSSDTLIDIALSVGFQTQAHFTTVFKRIVGSTPSRWRLEQLNVG